MRLVYTEGPKKGQEVKLNDVILFEDEKVTVVHTPKPPSAASGGKITIRNQEEGYEQTYYVGVLDMQWIEREDQENG